MSFPDVMIDVESLGVKPGAIILSIGAVKFNLRTGEIGDTFYRTIHAVDSEKHGFRAEAGAVMFWFKQPEEVQMAAIKMPDTVEVTLDAFSEWWGDAERPWANAPSMDCALLAAYYERLGRKCPWSYWQERCYRTMSGLWETAVPKHERVGVHHNALDDAIYQIERLMKIREYMNRRRA